MKVYKFISFLIEKERKTKLSTIGSVTNSKWIKVTSVRTPKTKQYSSKDFIK